MYVKKLAKEKGI